MDLYASQGQYEMKAYHIILGLIVWMSCDSPNTPVSDTSPNLVTDSLAVQIIKVEALTADSTQTFTDLKTALKNAEDVLVLKLPPWRDAPRPSGFPMEVIQFSNLLELRISSGQLKQLPPEIGQLTNLKVLDLSNNSFTSLPPEIGNLKNLEVLKINDNFELDTFPAEIANLRSLKYLDISLCWTYHFPIELCQLTQLEYLNAMKTGVEELPDCIGNLINLKTLKLNNNPLKKIPAEFGRLSKLDTLWLINTEVAEFPVEMSNLAELSYLWVYPNKKFRKEIEILLPKTNLKP